MQFRRIAFAVALGLIIPAISAHRHLAAQSEPRHIDVVAKRFTYQPAEINLKVGQPVVISFKSMDVTHGIHFEAPLNLQAKIEKGVGAELSFTPTEVGDVVGHCAVFCGSGHGGMVLTLHVTE